jgi:hypothetical protein
MDDQFFKERFNTSANVEKTDPETYNQIDRSDPYTGQDVSEVGTRVLEPPMGETVAEVGLEEETIIHGSAMGDTPYYKAKVSEETNTDVPLVSKPVSYQDPMEEKNTQKDPVSAGSNAGLSPALFNPQESAQFRTRWGEIQGKFVDEPRAAVQQADKLVSEVIEQITQKFASERSTLEGQWMQGNDVSTEDLRKALQSYRSFFNRLVV